MSSAFYITARSTPVAPGAGQYGRGTRLVLYDAPSPKVAATWAEKYIQELLLLDRAEQKLVEFKVIPMHDHLLSMNPDEAIDWPALIAHTEKPRGSFLERHLLRPIEHLLPPRLRHSLLARAERGSIEQGSSLRFRFQGHDVAESVTAPARPHTDSIAAMKKQVPQASQYNWRPSRYSYYIAHREDRAFIVRAMNIFFASRPYTRALGANQREAHDVSINAWPGARPYMGRGS